MCTVTYIPAAKNNFILTSNRDESPLRSANNLVKENLFGQKLIFPKDIKGGTWIATSSADKLVCILNGAFKKHAHQPPYRRSRGLMALDFFSFDRSRQFFNQYTFEEMEPFTMIIFDRGELFELRWDEHRKHIRKLNTKEPHIWSSSTLYPAPVQKKREQWFRDWLKQTKTFSREAILDLHRNGGEGDPFNDYVMNRHNMVRTVSITSVEKRDDEFSMSFYNLLKKQEYFNKRIFT